MMSVAAARRSAIISRDALQRLIDLLGERHDVIAPIVRDGAIVCDRISRIDEMPVGWRDRQEPGRYRLERRADEAVFGFTVGPQAWKRYLHPPVETLWTMRKGANGLDIETEAPPARKLAFIGVRACDLAAITVQDRVFCDGPYQDGAYAARRNGAFIVAVNCAEAASTCFCVSMNTGPKAESGFDLALTELTDAGGHRFVVEIGSAAGRDILGRIPSRPASENDLAAAAAVTERAIGKMGRQLETGGLKELLLGNLNHPRWDDVAARCLSCGNCTMVCPTCFCTTVEDHSDLAGTTAMRLRKWDSCFTLDFSFIHGGSVRNSPRSRYRQWITHKLANWIDQFGTSGCVGCGRCITWCPVGIDITAEAAAIRADPDPQPGARHGDA
jgi:ferredoxin